MFIFFRLIHVLKFISFELRIEIPDFNKYFIDVVVRVWWEKRPTGNPTLAMGQLFQAGTESLQQFMGWANYPQKGSESVPFLVDG